MEFAGRAMTLDGGENKATMASFETELLVVLLVKHQIVIGFWQLYVYVYQVNDDNRILCA